jgi:hypothetical protein
MLLTYNSQLPAKALQNIRDQFTWRSFAWMMPEIDRLRKHWRWLLLLVPSVILTQMLVDIDYTGHDAIESGVRIFTWLPLLKGHTPHFQTRKSPTGQLFPLGINSIVPSALKQQQQQQQLYDCKFLAALSSLSRSDRGRKQLFRMFKQNADGTTTVTFPGAPSEPITVSPLTDEEKFYYSTTGDEVKNGLWVPILEKAYGSYRVEHQDIPKTLLRLGEHAILDMRFTKAPGLLGFGASYGAGDEVGAQMLDGGYTRCIETTAFELGKFGLGKGYVTLRQLQSWFDRPGAEKTIQEEEHNALVKAMHDGSIVVASTEISGDAEYYHLFSGHAYAVLDYDSKTRMLLLKDPLCADIWNPSTQSARDGVEDGLFKNFTYGV